MEMNLESILLPGVDPKRPVVIAGPCSAETEEQVLETARGLAAKGIKIFRAGIWKPRTKPGGFEGIGIIGLEWLKKVKQETGMYIATEVATKVHVEEALKAGVDILWIGARTTVNPFAVQEIADALKGVDIPVLIKNPVNPDLELWIGAIERIYGAGIRRIGVTVGSAPMIKKFTAIYPYGIFLLNYAAVCLNCKYFAIPAISAGNVN
jgi:chorismate mutase